MTQEMLEKKVNLVIFDIQIVLDLQIKKVLVGDILNINIKYFQCILKINILITYNSIF